MIKHLTLRLLLVGGMAVLGHGAAIAQQAATGEADIFAPAANQDAATSDQTLQPTQKPTAKKTKLAAASTKPAKTDTGGDAEQRLQQIEEQLADLQVVVGTLESTGKGRAAGMAPASDNNDADVRVGRLEAQMQGLNAQMADLANQLRALEAKLQGNGAGATQMRSPPAVPRQSNGLQAAAPGEQPAAADTGLGKTIVSSGNFGDQAGGSNDGVAADTLPQVQQPAQSAALTPSSNDPQTAYDLAYGLILQQDYAGAESAFHDYITRFPQSPLASNAHYWLGQSFYARGQYKPAADAFLKGYKTYRTGQKAPDSLLKVAMSLSRLGQKDMACSAFTALDGEFPNASVQVKHLAQTERERSGC